MQRLYRFTEQLDNNEIGLRIKIVLTYFIDYFNLPLLFGILVWVSYMPRRHPHST